MAQCTHIKDDGERCGQAACKGEDKCIWHSPTRRKEAAEARRRGGQTAGRNRRKVPPRDALPTCGLETAEHARVWSSFLVQAIARGNLDAATAQRLSTALRTFLSAQKQSDLEKEVASLRAKIKELENGR